MKKNVTVITGGSGGMGKAIAKELGKSTLILLSGRSEAKLLAAQKELTELGIESYVMATDVANKADVEKLAAYAQTLGNVTQVIHTSGVSPADTNADTIFKINAVGTVNMTEAFVSILAEGGVIINFSSMAAHLRPRSEEWTKVFEAWNEPDFFERLQAITAPVAAYDPDNVAGMAYVVSKQFVIYYSQKYVELLAKKGCRILSISPGSYLTPMHQKLIDNNPDEAENQMDLLPLGRWGHPYEIAALVAFLCSPGAAFINGVDILADGGQTANTFIPQI